MIQDSWLEDFVLASLTKGYYLARISLFLVDRTLQFLLVSHLPQEFHMSGS